VLQDGTKKLLIGAVMDYEDLREIVMKSRFFGAHPIRLPDSDWPNDHTTYTLPVGYYQ
tara:strand:+ start:257 stop:430 length:174 start_codon:yes stop_codon:yes gene_type:complete